LARRLVDPRVDRVFGVGLASGQPGGSEREEDGCDEQHERWDEQLGVSLESVSGGGQPVHAARARELANTARSGEHEIEQEDEHDLRRHRPTGAGHGCDHSEVGQRGRQLDRHDRCTDEDGYPLDDSLVPDDATACEPERHCERYEDDPCADLDQVLRVRTRPVRKQGVPRTDDEHDAGGRRDGEHARDEAEQAASGVVPGGEIERRPHSRYRNNRRRSAVERVTA
jgi:hypothetical protein